MKYYYDINDDDMTSRWSQGIVSSNITTTASIITDFVEHHHWCQQNIETT